MKKIPEHAECVFKGIIYDVYHWQQEMFDGSFETFERLHRKPSVIVLAFDEEGNVFYGKQNQVGHKEEYLSLFGGRAEEGETPLDVAKRELKEETGMESNNWEMLGEHFDIAMKIDYEVYCFLAKDCKKVSEPKLDTGESIEIFKTSIDGFVDEVMINDSFKEYFLKKDISDFSSVKKQDFKNKLKLFVKGDK